MMIDIIGAGIGGLTTAIALEKKGYSINIFEQAKEIKPVGAGIILANNAMQIYKKLGLEPLLEAKGNHIDTLNITKEYLEPISRMDLSYFERKFGVKSIAIHRGTLQQILVDALKNTELNLNHQLAHIEKKEKDYELTFEGREKVLSSILIGADGLNSKVRGNLFSKSSTRNAKQVCWRGVTDFDLPERYKKELNEVWGRHGRFGFVQIAEGKIYWYALKSFKADSNELKVEDLTTYFEAYHPMIKEIISSTHLDQINTAEISDLAPIREWYKDNVCLIGDAAHATTPNMGQGACQAIEDAYVLSELLNDRNLGFNEAFKLFQEMRLSKAHQVVKSSWTVGKIAHVSNPLLKGMRDKVMQWTPESFSRKQSEKIFQIPTI